jgi:hypothetical protein
MADVFRRAALHEHEFIRDHLITRAPVVVTDEIPQWPAFRSWTWDYLVKKFGQCEVDVCDDFFVPTATMTFADFVAHVAERESHGPERAYVRWFARNGSGEGRWADDVFHALRDDWSPPRFLPTSGYIVPFAGPRDRVSASRDPFPYRALFVSAAGARTRLHLDPWASSAVLCQVAGTKHVSMWPPDQHELMLRLATEQNGLDPVNEVPPAIQGTLNAGEVLFVPAGWWHQVDTVTDSISLTWNFLHVSVAERLRDHVRAYPDDPELAVVAYFLAGFLAGDEPDRDVATLVTDAIEAQTRT